MKLHAVYKGGIKYLTCTLCLLNLNSSLYIFILQNNNHHVTVCLIQRIGSNELTQQHILTFLVSAVGLTDIFVQSFAPMTLAKPTMAKIPMEMRE